MHLIRDRLRGVSFRGRLLLLLVVVSLVQAAVAAFTFNSLQSKPVEQRITAQLNANLRAVSPVIDEEIETSSERLRELTGNDALVRAIATGDRATADRILSGDTTTTLPGSDPTATTSSADADVPSGYVTDNSGEVVAGQRPDAPLVEADDVTTSAMRRGAELIGTLHVPVVADEEFMHDRIGSYASDGVSVFIADADRLATSDGVVDRPGGIEAGKGTFTIGGKERYGLVQPVLDGDVVIGASVPAKVVAAEKRESMKNLIGFLFALLTLMLVVSFVITKSVGDALGKFADITQELAGGDMSIRIPVTGSDEIAVLSSSFNEMAENLETRMKHLVDARARMRRQVDLFGEAVANATDMREMLTAVCGLAIESTSATHARFWTIDEDGHYAHSVCIGLRPNDTEPCTFEKAVARSGRAAMTDQAPHWLVVPSRSGDQVIGVMTLVSATHVFTVDDMRVADRIAVQAAVAIDNARMHEILREQATRDGLTGLPNHRSLQDTLRKMLTEAYQRNIPLGVGLLDIDNFKRINDTYGHQVGDEAIKALGRVLAHGIGEMGLAGRYGGEEFVVLMPGCDAAAACRIADRLREDISHIEVPLEGGDVLRFTASFGISNVDQYSHVVDAADLFKHADMGLYKAKRSGKNRVELATPDMTMTVMSDEEKAALEARERGDSTTPKAA